MLKKIIVWIVIVALFRVMYISTSKSAMERISNERNTADTWWGVYQGKSGDLSNMAYLDFAREFKTEENDLKVWTNNGQNNVELYLRGDSYTRSIAPGAYSFLSHFYFSNRWQTNFGYNLDRTKKNVVIFEITERLMREQYNDLRVLKYFTDRAHVNKYSSGNELTEDDGPEPTFLDVFFNKNINQNLQYNLFNYRFLTPMFESKAAFNYYVLGRASGEVVVSKDRKYLMLRETVTQNGTRSAYSRLPPEEVTQLISNLNQMYDYYKAAGFDDVYFCIIPNPVTVLQPDAYYNKLIPLIQYDPRLRMKMIDLYKVFRQEPQKYYSHGDSHWNNAGRLVWLQTVNGILERLHAGNP